MHARTCVRARTTHSLFSHLYWTSGRTVRARVNARNDLASVAGRLVPRKAALNVSVNFITIIGNSSNFVS